MKGNFVTREEAAKSLRELAKRLEAEADGKLVEITITYRWKS